MRPLAPGEYVALAAVAGVLAADVVLHHTGNELVSTCVRRSLLWTIAVWGTAIHLTPWDRLLGRRSSCSRHREGVWP